MPYRLATPHLLHQMLKSDPETIAQIDSEKRGVILRVINKTVNYSKHQIDQYIYESTVRITSISPDIAFILFGIFWSLPAIKLS